jgi:hypothetical protein
LRVACRVTASSAAACCAMACRNSCSGSEQALAAGRPFQGLSGLATISATERGGRLRCAAQEGG